MRENRVLDEAYILGFNAALNYLATVSVDIYALIDVVHPAALSEALEIPGSWDMEAADISAEVHEGIAYAYYDWREHHADQRT